MADQPDLILTRTPTLAQVIDAAIRQGLAEVHVALPGKVSKVDLVKQLVDVDLQVQSLAQLDEDGTRTAAPIPTITNVPIEFPGANGFRITFPVAVGDTGLVIFSEADISDWKRNGTTAPKSSRRHHLADAVFRPGLISYSKPWTDVPSDGIAAGYDGGPQLVLRKDHLELGGTPSGPPTDWVALASLVKTEIGKVRDNLNSLITDYNGHVHLAGTMLDSTSNAVTGSTAPTISTATPPDPVADVKSAKVQSD